MKRHERGFLNPEPDEEARTQQVLELSEAALFGGLRRQLEGAALAGSQLASIRAEKLYLAAGFKTFESYCGQYLQMARDQVRRYLELHEVVKMLQAAKLELPTSETQAVMLSKIPRARLIGCWRTVLAHCVQHQIALDDGIVRRAIRLEIQSSQQIVVKPSGEKACKGVPVTLKC